MVSICIDLDIGEQLRCILHLIDQNRWLMQLQKLFGIVFCERTFVQIVKRNITTGSPLHEFLQHGRLSYLSRSSYKYNRIFLRDLLHDFLKTSGNIAHVRHLLSIISADFSSNYILAEAICFFK